MMRPSLALAVVLACAACSGHHESAAPAGVDAGSAPPQPGTFTKLVLDTAYRAEGVGVLDVDRDGHLDIATDEYWYAGPTFSTRHEIRGAEGGSGGPPETFDPTSPVYAHCFGAFPWDVDGDGWMDLVIAPHIGDTAYWYQNPHGAPDAHWTPHVIAPAGVFFLETPIVVDLFGDRSLVLLASDATQGVLGWYTPPADPMQPWTLHPISGRAFAGGGGGHGIGAGDVNGDGRLDVLTGYAWFEQTADRNVWKMHPFDAGNACSRMWTYDVDGDGLADVLCTRPHDYGTYWYQQERAEAGASPTFVPHTIDQTVSELHNLQLDDLDGDGVPEIIAGKRWLAHSDGSDPGAHDPAVLVSWSIRKGGSSVTFDKRVIDDDSGAGGSFTVTDVDGDGKPDIVTSNKKGLFVFHQN